LIVASFEALIRIGKWGLFYTYDILCAKDYNPNERTDFFFSRDNPKFVLAEQLRRAVLSFYTYHNKTDATKKDSMDEVELWV
jgi:hypothetical protein